MAKVSDREYHLTANLMACDKEVNRLKADIARFLSQERSYLNQIDCLERKISELEGVISGELKPRKGTQKPSLALKQ